MHVVVWLDGMRVDTIYSWLYSLSLKYVDSLISGSISVRIFSLVNNNYIIPVHNESVCYA